MGSGTVTPESKKGLADQLGEAHLNILPFKKLVVCLATMALGLFISFTDQTSVTIALPHIGKDLNAESTINWAGTAALLANTVFQVLFGRLSDIFGRKSMLMSCLIILAIADLACGFAQTGVQFYVFRAFAGIGNGGIQLLTMTIVSDIVTLKQRGKYQGILVSSVGIGNATGPFIMAAFISKLSWRYFYYMLCPLVCVVATVIFFLVKNPRKKNLDAVLLRREKFKRIDYIGMLLLTAALTLLLIPILGGGLTYKWDSSIVIVMFIVGGLCLFAFLLVEWKIPELPMIPMRLFENLLLASILGLNFFFGMAYYGFSFYMPYYFQIVRNKLVIENCCFILALVLPQLIVLIIAGQIISWSGHYKFVVVAGYIFWVISCGLLLLWDTNTPTGVCIVVLLVMGTGVGATFQPTMVAAQAQAKKSERAVVISARNVIRLFGGAMGVSMGSLIVSNSMLGKINKAMVDPGEYSNIPQSYLIYLKNHIYLRIDVTGLNLDQQKIIRKLYMESIRDFFYLLIPLIAICLLSTLVVKDRGLQCIDEIEETNESQNDEAQSEASIRRSVETGEASHQRTEKVVVDKEKAI